MSAKIWQVPNKSKAMAQVFARKSGEHRKTRSRVRERQEWQREVEDEDTNNQLDIKDVGPTSLELHEVFNLSRWEE